MALSPHGGWLNTVAAYGTPIEANFGEFPFHALGWTLTRTLLDDCFAELKGLLEGYLRSLTVLPPGLNGSVSDSLGRPRRHKPLGTGLDEREHTAIGVDEQIVLRPIRKHGGACAIRFDSICAGVGLVTSNLPVKVS